MLNENKILEEFEKGLGEGDLTLIVTCTKCNADFDLNRESIVMALLNDTSFIEYLRWIQNSKCKICHKENLG